MEIPLRYFKVAVFLHQGELSAVGYLVDQAPQLADLPLGPFRTFQTPIRDIAELTGLNLGQLVAVDRMPIAATLGAARVGSTWRELASMECIDLDFDLKD